MTAVYNFARYEGYPLDEMRRPQTSCGPQMNRKRLRAERGEVTVDTKVLAGRSREELLRRNNIFETFFRSQSPRLAEACHEMSRRFLAGGRLLAFGDGSAATDAEHVSVEFVHPVIVGKRALP